MSESLVHRCMIIPASLAPHIRQIASVFGESADNMWTTALAHVGTTVTTHYISSGLIWQSFADMIASPEALKTGCENAGISVSLETCQSLLAACDISEEEPFSAMARLGLVIFTEQET